MNHSFLQQKWIDTAVGKLCYYHDYSFPGRPTFVFLHGLSSNHTTWLAMIEQLHGQQINSLALDLRGHGHSDKTKRRSLYTLPVFVDDLRRVIEKEQLDQFTLVGYSYGGPIAIEYILQYPNSAANLILISVNHVSPPVYMRLGFLLPWCFQVIQMMGFLLLWQKRKIYHYYHHGEAKNYWRSVWLGLNTMPLSVNMWMFSEVFRVDFRERLAEVRVPTLIVRGQHDPFLSQAEAEDMAEMMENAQVAVAEDTGHFVASRAQDEVVELLNQFV